MQGDELAEKVARAISGAPFPSKASLRKARAAIDAIPGLRGVVEGTATIQPSWQDISTAPKDTRLLGIVDGDVRFIMWTKTSHVPIYGWCLVDQGAEDADLCRPEAWMPLPAPAQPAPPGGGDVDAQ